MLADNFSRYYYDTLVLTFNGRRANMQASELFSAHLKYLATDAQKWRDLFDEHAVLEFPYAPSLGAPEKYEGINNIFEIVQTAVISQLIETIFSNIRIQSINSENAVGEFELMSKVKTTGNVYSQRYITLLTSKNGKITHMKEYFNPLQVQKAFASLPAI